MKKLISFIAVLAVIVTNLFCTQPQQTRKYYTSTKHEINFEMKGQKKYIVESYADRVGFDWRVTLTIHNLDVTDITGAALKQEAYPVSFRGEDNKSIITWEFPTDRRNVRTPFELRIGLDDESGKYIDITARHRLKSAAREIALGVAILSAEIGLRFVF